MSRRRAALRVIQTPVISAALLALLAADAWWLADHSPNSTCGGALHNAIDSLFGAPRGDWCIVYSPEFLIRDHAGALNLINFRDNLALSDARASGELVGDIVRTGHHSLDGFWALVSETTEEHINVWPAAGTSFTPAQDLAIRQMYFAIHPELAHIPPQGYTTHRTLWTGWAHDTAAASVALVFVVSLGWVPRLPIRRRTTRRLAAGLCPNCAYDLKTGRTQTCPECGWNRQ